MCEHRSCASRDGHSQTLLTSAAPTEHPGAQVASGLLSRRLLQVYPESGDLPVRISSVGQVHPLVDLSHALGIERFAAVMARAERMRVAHLKAQDVRRQLNEGNAPPKVDSLLISSLDEMYEPFEDVRLERGARLEWIEMLHQARKVDCGELTKVLSEFKDGPLVEHRERVIATSLGALITVEALRQALWAEQIVLAGHDLENYRSASVDFDPVKGRYLEIFELASHTLVFMARIANIATRGCSATHSDGYRASLRQALGHAKTRERETWLIDFPVAVLLYSKLKRGIRNDISHGRVRYAPRQGVLLYGEGRRESYLEFLIDYLNAVRLTHYLLGVILTLHRYWALLIQVKMTKEGSLGNSGCAS